MGERGQTEHAESRPVTVSIGIFLAHQQVPPPGRPRRRTRTKLGLRLAALGGVYRLCRAAGARCQEQESWRKLLEEILCQLGIKIMIGASRLEESNHWTPYAGGKRLDWLDLMSWACQSFLRLCWIPLLQFCIWMLRLECFTGKLVTTKIKKMVVRLD